MERTIKIGGKDCEVIVREATRKKLAKRFNRVLSIQQHDAKSNKELADVRRLYQSYYEELLEYKNKGIITEEEMKEKSKQLAQEEMSFIRAMKTFIPDKYYYFAIWDLLVKKGIWPFRKPFRSANQMYKNLLSEEAKEIIKFINKEVLFRPTTEVEDDKKKD